MNNKNTILAIIGIGVIAFAVYYFVAHGPRTESSAARAPNDTTVEASTTPIVVNLSGDTAPTGGRADNPQTSTSSDTSFVTITQSDNGKTVHVKQGERFSIALGEMNWSLDLSDPTIASRVKNIMTVRGTQGVYTADKVGTTVLAADGRPNCAPGTMCAQFIVNVKITIVVDPK